MPYVPYVLRSADGARTSRISRVASPGAHGVGGGGALPEQRPWKQRRSRGQREPAVDPPPTVIVTSAFVDSAPSLAVTRST